MNCPICDYATHYNRMKTHLIEEHEIKDEAVVTVLVNLADRVDKIEKRLTKLWEDSNKRFFNGN